MAITLGMVQYYILQYTTEFPASRPGILELVAFQIKINCRVKISNSRKIRKRSTNGL